MAPVLACVDGSEYDGSVCDHALWLAGSAETQVQVLRAGPARVETRSAPEILAAERMQDHGATDIRLLRTDDDFIGRIAQCNADFVAMGKRGRGSAARRTTLGSNVVPVLERWAGPVLLASQVFLPIRKALVLLDADLGHRAAIDFVLERPVLSDLELDVAIVSTDPAAARDKRDFVHDLVGSRQAALIELAAPGITDALLRYMEARSADVFVISRPVLFPDADARLRRLESCGLWAWRTPVLVC